MKTRLTLLLLGLLLAFVAGTEGRDDVRPRLVEKPGPARLGSEVECVLVDDGQPLRVRLAVEIDGQDVGSVWQESLGRLFSYLDRDGDKTLSPAEAARLPSAFDLRRMLWGSFAPAAGIGEVWKTADLDGDGKLSVDEVVQFYLRQGIGVTVGTGEAPNTARLQQILLGRLDGDRDGKLTRNELRKAEAALLPLDRNEDEMITPDELIRGNSYPGTSGSWHVWSGTPAGEIGAKAPPVLVLPADSNERGWAERLRARLAREGKMPTSRYPLLAGLDHNGDRDLSAAELAGWREQAPDIALRAGWQKGRPSLVRVSADRERAVLGLEASCGPHRLSMWVDDGKLPELAEKAQGALRQQFLAADVDRKGYLTADDAAVGKDINLRLLLAVADRNGDGKLSQDELKAWQALQTQLVAGMLLVTVLDHGRGLFEMLDADGDGRLSVRELRHAAVRLEAASCLVDGVLRPERLPRFWRVAVSRGHPRSSVFTPGRSGPEWFRAMDRNGDGDVSAREFIGPGEVFRKLDSDGDGLLTVREAEKAEALPR